MNRTTFLGSAMLAPAAQLVPGGTHLVERVADFDLAAFGERFGRPADQRMVWEAVAFVPTILNNVKNALNGLQFGFGVDPARVLTVFAGHGPSSSLTYADAMWTKYRIGEFFGIKDSASGDPLQKNAFYPSHATASTDPDDTAGAYHDTSVEGLTKRGVAFLTCHTAVEEQSRAIVKRGFAPAGMAADDVARDLLTNLVPGATVVPAMVATIAYLQNTYRYAYLTIQ